MFLSLWPTLFLFTRLIHASDSYQNQTFAAASCLALNNNVSISNITQIRFATLISAGSNFTGDAPEPSYNVLQAGVPEACRVALVVQTSLNSSARFEVWMPMVENWNGRFLAVGNGGWAGGVNYPDIVNGLRQGRFFQFIVLT